MAISATIKYFTTQTPSYALLIIHKYGKLHKHLISS